MPSLVNLPTLHSLPSQVESPSFLSWLLQSFLPVFKGHNETRFPISPWKAPGCIPHTYRKYFSGLKTTFQGEHLWLLFIPILCAPVLDSVSHWSERRGHKPTPFHRSQSWSEARMSPSLPPGSLVCLPVTMLPFHPGGRLGSLTLALKPSPGHLPLLEDPFHSCFKRGSHKTMGRVFALQVTHWGSTIPSITYSPLCTTRYDPEIKEIINKNYPQQQCSDKPTQSIRISGY